MRNFLMFLMVFIVFLAIVTLLTPVPYDEIVPVVLAITVAYFKGADKRKTETSIGKNVQEK